MCSSDLNGFRRQIIDITDRGDPPVADADVAVKRRRTCAVNDLGVTNQQIEHNGLLS